MPCALVSQREASAVFGAPATSGQPFATTSCSWIVARKPGEPAPAPGAVTYVLSAASYDIRP